jgi:hypothetical protein
MLRRHLFFSAFPFVLFSACDPTWQVDVTVEVPREVQDAYAERWPAQLIVQAEPRQHAGRTPQGAEPRRIAVLCAGSDEDLVFHTQLHGGMVCATEMTLRAQLVPVDAQDAVECEETPDGKSPLPAAATSDLAQAVAVAFKGDDDTDKYCTGGDEGVKLRLSLP